MGSLIFIANGTRPDIAHAVSSLARHMANPTENHWRAATGVLQYLGSTIDKGLIFQPGAVNLHGYVDASHADSPGAKSTHGYAFLAAGAAFSWASKLQTAVE